MAHARISFDHGSLTPAELAVVFAGLRADITFVDAEGLVRYYSAYRIFSRTPACLDRDVLDCHTESSRPGIARMLSEFASGWRDEAVFVEKKDGRNVNVRYSAVRDADGVYLGCLETAQWADEASEDITP